jgi:hypothetical protein
MAGIGEVGRKLRLRGPFVGKMLSVPPTSLRPAFFATVTPPGKTPRASMAAASTSLLAVALLGAAALLGLGDELPSGLVNGNVALKLFVHRACLSLSAVACLSAIILAIMGWSRAKALSIAAFVGASAWLALFVWARFVS